MKFLSTRNIKRKVSPAEAISEGLSSLDGGLYVPESFPAVSLDVIEGLCEKSYEERAAYIMSLFLSDYTEQELLEYAEKAYARFDGDAAPLVKIDEHICILELFHGPTYAFKDIALTMLPHLMTAAKKKLGKSETTLIPVATSGDTGKAALEGFKNVEGTAVAVFYPEQGVSPLQKLQMKTTKGDNVAVFGIEGNFDDAQNAVKEIFSSAELKSAAKKDGYSFSSANSINFGRLVPQIVYYFSSYCDLVSGGAVKRGDKVNFCVPSGNFGNILAAYYAKQMGLPVGMLICASNKNNVLTDFFDKGTYSTGREFYKTTSPSMDILISSNLERLIFELSGRDDVTTKARMDALKASGSYTVTADEFRAMSDSFFAGCAQEKDVAKALGDCFIEYGYLMDTHTSVAAHVYKEYVKKTGDKTMTVIVSTASPYKFAADVLKFLGETPVKNDKKNLELLEDVSAMPVPDDMLGLFDLAPIHNTVIKKDEVKTAVLEYCAKNRRK